jgi:hypothetical protein
MRNPALVILAFSALLPLACDRRSEAPAPPPKAVATTTSTAVEDLSNADAKLKIVPEPPPFVRIVELSRAGTLVPNDPVVPVAAKETLTLTAQMNQVPAGLALRYEVLKEGDEKPVMQERKMPEVTARSVPFQIPLGQLKKGSYTLRLWSGGDMVFARKIERK